MLCSNGFHIYNVSIGLLYVVQLLLFLKAFSESEQTKLAILTGILLANSALPPPIITSLFTENVVKEGEITALLLLYSTTRYDSRLIAYLTGTSRDGLKWNFYTTINAPNVSFLRRSFFRADLMLSRQIHKLLI